MKQTLNFILSGPSGVGKSSIIKAVLERNPELGCPISYTDRAPRDGEENGKDYYFVSTEEMKNLETWGALAECTTAGDGAHYGIGREELRRMRRYPSAIMDLDTCGGQALRELLGDRAILILICPEYGYDLRDRLRCRGTENEQEISRRMEKGVSELSVGCGVYDYVIVNRSVEESASQLLAIMTSEHLRIKRQKEQVLAVLDDLNGVL